MSGRPDDLRLVPRGGRRASLALGSVAMVAASIAVFCGIYSRAGHTSSYLAIARPVEVGQAIEPDDLVSVAISGSANLDPIPASAAASVVGLQTSVSLVPGTLLTRGELETAFAPPAGESVVGVSLRASQMPASGLTPGQWVSVVLTGQDGEATPVVDPEEAAQGSADDSIAAGAAVPGAGTVLASTVPIIGEASAQDSAGSGSLVVSLEVPTGVAPTLATASTAGEVALVLVPAPSQTTPDSGS